MQANVRSDGYLFRPMTEADLPLVERWLREPHVREWWGNPDEQLALVTEDLDEPAMRQFIVAQGHDPFGYIQAYDLQSWPDPVFKEHPTGTQAIDQFIGNPDMIDRGHGSAFIRRFIDQLLVEGAPRIITDPDPKNPRAIRAYERAGFIKRGIVQTRDGPALLMIRDA